MVAELLVHVTCARSLDVTLLRALHFSHVMQLELVGAQLEGGDKPVRSPFDSCNHLVYDMKRNFAHPVLIKCAQ